MEIKLPERSRASFELLVQMAEGVIRDAVSSPPTELVAVETPTGGFEMRVQRVGVRQSYRHGK